MVEDPVPAIEVIAEVVEFEMLKVEVTEATTWETVMVFVMIAVDVTVVVEVEEESAREKGANARRTRGVSESRILM